MKPEYEGSGGRCRECGELWYIADGPHDHSNDDTKEK
jgi:hypothetical protein